MPEVWPTIGNGGFKLFYVFMPLEILLKCVQLVLLGFAIRAFTGTLIFRYIRTDIVPL